MENNMLKHILICITKSRSMIGEWKQIYRNDLEKKHISVDEYNSVIELINDLKKIRKKSGKNKEIKLLCEKSINVINAPVDCLIVTDQRIPLDESSNITEYVPVLGIGLDYEGTCSYITEDLMSVDLQYMNMVYCRFFHLPLTIAESDRLILREMTMQDLDELYKVYETLSDCSYIEQLYERKREEEFTKNYIKNMYGFYGYGLWLVIRKEDQKLIGRAGIENRMLDGENVQELGYLIGRPWQHKHYAKECCQMIIDYAKYELMLEKIYICTDSKNIPSISLAQKLGFEAYAMNIDGMNLYYKKL